MVQHLLIYEPRLGGHHLTWLRYVTEDFLSVGVRLTLAVDLRPASRELIENNFVDLSDKIKIISAYSEDGKYKGGSKTASLCLCLQESGAQEILMTNFDEIASSTLRRAAFGILPPKSLRGRLNGIYFRPRFMDSHFWPVGNIIKYLGFTKLCRGGWFNNLYLLDEYLIDRAKNKWRNCNFHFLPDVWSGNYSHDQKLARKKLQVPDDKFVYLNYGIGTRRKGLHLVIRAMLNFKLPEEAFLLSAGQIADDKELQQGVAELEKRGLARVINRYVSDAEEELCFAACDTVLLPYVKHFGSSGVLSRAAAAGKFVIASDEGLVAKRVREHDLGLIFDSENGRSLEEVMAKGLLIGNEKKLLYERNCLNYASSCSRALYRQALSKFYSPIIRETAKTCS